jgi:signal transduction histidine kinase
MSRSSLRLLIVDDSPEDQALYQRLLTHDSEHEYTIVTAESGEEGLALGRTASIDCVLLDYQLPDLDGLEFMQALNRRNGLIPFAVIMLTGYGSEVVASDAMKTGALDYLPKHVLTSQALVRAITNAVERHRLRMAVEDQRLMLQRTNDELQRRNEAIQSFHHALSHELRTPLTVIMGYLSLVLEVVADPLSDGQRDSLKIAKEGCDQMGLAIDDLLDITRLQTGKLKVVPRRVAVGDVVARVVNAMKPSALAHGIRMHHQGVQSVPDVCIDEKRITQVLTNLLSNALKFTSAGGDIIVSVREDPQHTGFVQVSVQDTGCGIEAEDCAKIFDRLYQVRGDDIASPGGLGLGLHISRELVRLHGGEIWVESNVGHGSTFSFTIPTDRVQESSATLWRETAA